MNKPKCGPCADDLPCADHPGEPDIAAPIVINEKHRLVEENDALRSEIESLRSELRQYRHREVVECLGGPGVVTDTPADAPLYVQAVTPAEIELQRDQGWPDFHPEDFCHLCGRRNPVWTTSADEWEFVTGDMPRGVLTILCPSCFAAAHEAAHGMRVCWDLTDFADSGPAITPEEAADDARLCECGHQRDLHSRSGNGSCVAWLGDAVPGCPCVRFNDT